jgi:hypothetical protein
VAVTRVPMREAPSDENDLETLRMEIVMMWIELCSAQLKLSRGAWMEHREVCDICAPFDAWHREYITTFLYPKPGRV